MIKINRKIKQFTKILNSHGFQCYLVGGAVRDILMRRNAEDYDIATDALPKDIKKIFKFVIETGIKHGTVTVFFKGLKVEVTTFRVEQDYSDARHPDKVIFISSIYEDLKRRDFTINAIAYDPIKNKIIDPHNGIGDIKKRLIRAIGNPIDRFYEDGLRLLRACRFSSQLGFNIEENTFQGIKKSIERIKNISVERIRDELIKILLSSKPSKGLICMHETGLLKEIIPELETCVNVRQPEMHCFDVFKHSLYTCDAAKRDDLILRIAALFHDIGKPETFFVDKYGEIRFHTHEEKGAEMTERILKRLKFSNREVALVTHLIRNHMFNYSEEWTDSAIRRFITRVGNENIDRLLALRRADQIGKCNKRFISDNLIKFENRIQSVLAKTKLFSRKDLAVNGNDIMQYLNIEQGEIVGIILNYLFETVLESPEANTKETLLGIAKEYYETRLKPYSIS